VRLLHQHGAHVFFGDISIRAAAALERELRASPGPSPSTIQFVPCDVTSYGDNVRLFATAFGAFGRVDHAVANAGRGERGNMFDPGLTLETVREEPTEEMSVVDVNLRGPLYFARVASVYLRQGGGGEGWGDKSLTFTSSVGGFREDPGLWVYVPSKHGVLGLMRVVKERFRQAPYRIRTNAICPWMTTSKMTEGVQTQWGRAGLPRNDPRDVARVIVGVLADATQSGGAMYIEGGRAWDVEAGLVNARPEWLGERQAADLDRGTAALGGGEGWVMDGKVSSKL
jgi:NAD(P)-dependent dehydrogenase (short-subunit alcohol dehydrogenase family)